MGRERPVLEAFGLPTDTVQAARRLDDTDPDARAPYGDLLVKIGKAGTVADEIGADGVTSANDNSISSLLRDARAHLGHRRFDLAVDVATEAIRLDPRRSEIYVIRAEALRKLNKADRALADLALAIRLDPDRAAPYVIRAEIYRRRCELDRAIDDATQAIFLDPHNAAAFSIRASCRRAIGDEEGAIQDAGEEMRIDPTRPPTAEDKETRPSRIEGPPKDSIRTIPDAYRDLFADGNPVDETYRTRSPEEIARLLGRDSRYKPEVSTPALPGIGALPPKRHRRRSGWSSAKTIRLALALVVMFLGGSFIASTFRSGKKSPSKPELTLPRVVQVEPESAGTSSSPPQSRGSSAEVFSFLGHTGKVTCVAFSPDGQLAVSGGEDKSVRMWDVSTGREVWKSGNFTKRLLAVSFPTDRKTIVAQDQVSVKRLDAETGRSVTATSTPEIENTALGNEGRFLVFEGGGKLFLNDLSLGHSTHVADVWTPRIIYNVGGKSVFCGGYESPQHVEELRDINTGRVLKEYRGSRDRTHALAVSPDGRFLAAGSGVNNPKVQQVSENTVRVWEVASGKLVRQFGPLGGWLDAVAFSPDSRLILAGGGGRQSDWGGFAAGADNSIRLWDVESGRELGKFDGHKAAISTLKFSPDGRFALSGSIDATVRLWRMPAIGDDRSTVLANPLPDAVGGEPARTIAAVPLTTYLVDLPRVGLRDHKGWWSDRGELVLGGDRKPLIFEDAHSTHGIYLHANPSPDQAGIAFRLGGRFESFRSEALIPDMLPRQGNPITPLILTVKGDERTIWRSKPLTSKGDHQTCSISVKGIQVLSLTVDCRGPNNWGLSAWVEPRLFVSSPDAAGLRAK